VAATAAMADEVSVVAEVGEVVDLKILTGGHWG